LHTRAQRIALVAQESELLFPLRVWEYVLQGRYPYGRRLRFESAEDCLMAGNALAQVGADSLRDRWMDQLSGGEKQRVILSRAMAQQPSLLLLDEPTQHLDIGGKVELLRRLRKLADENRYTVIVVTHELNLAAVFADRVAGGSVRAAGAGGSFRGAARGGDAGVGAATCAAARSAGINLRQFEFVVCRSQLRDASPALIFLAAPETINRDSAHGKTVKIRRRRATVRRNFL
jgi:hypothetical protein